MKFFISHSSQNKPTIKAVLSKMPLNIKTWLDEEKLIWGSNLTPTFQGVITTQADYVILFVSESSAKSAWVQKEVQWALNKEKKDGRIIILPIYIQSGEEDCSALFPQLNDRKKLILNNFEDVGIEKFAKDLSNYLFAFICNELSEAYSPTKSVNFRTINNADNIMNEYFKHIRNLVFYHRESNPITVDELYEQLSNKTNLNWTRDQFDFILEQLSARGMMPGLYYDGYELYLEEEHVAWKNEMAHEAKVSIAKKAASMIRNNMTVYIDAGSTTAELVKIICNRIQSNNLHTITLVTIAISHANAIAECCVAKGFDDTNSNIKLEFLGGLLRPNTEATVPKHQNEKLSDSYDSFDLAFIGANGLSNEKITILPNAEYKRKKEALDLAKQKVVLCDASKSGIVLKGDLVTKDDDFILITNNDESNHTFKEIITSYEGKVRLV